MMLNADYFLCYAFIANKIAVNLPYTTWKHLYASIYVTQYFFFRRSTSVFSILPSSSILMLRSMSHLTAINTFLLCAVSSKRALLLYAILVLMRLARWSFKALDLGLTLAFLRFSRTKFWTFLLPYRRLSTRSLVGCPYKVLILIWIWLLSSARCLRDFSAALFAKF